MSFDLMILENNFAPASDQDLLQWYKSQTQWAEGHNYDDPLVTSPNLKKWFLAIIDTFPAINGPYAKEDITDENDKATDYSIGQQMIYACFSWAEAEQGFYKTIALAEKNGLGVIDVNANDFKIIWPPFNDKFLFPYAQATNERFEQDMKQYAKVIRRLGLTNEGIGGWSIADFACFDENKKMSVRNIKLGHAVESYIQKNLQKSIGRLGKSVKT